MNISDPVVTKSERIIILLSSNPQIQLFLDTLHFFEIANSMIMNLTYERWIFIRILKNDDHSNWALSLWYILWLFGVLQLSWWWLAIFNIVISHCNVVIVVFRVYQACVFFSFSFTWHVFYSAIKTNTEWKMT